MGTKGIRAEGAVDGFGVFLDPRTVRFERVLPAHVKRVWGYLTETELAAGWFAEAEIEPREGGEVELRIVVGQVPARELSGARGARHGPEGGGLGGMRSGLHKGRP